MSSAPDTQGEAAMTKGGAPAPRQEPSPAPTAHRPAAARAALRMPAALRWALLALTFLLMLGSTWFASRQAPHPDMFRPIGNWDITRLDWWRYPLERNAFKRQIVHGNLNAVFLLPSTQKLWAVGAAGLVLHSEDGGATWIQQSPADAAAADAQDGSRRTKTSAAWPLLPQAVAAEVANSKAPQAQTPAPEQAKGGPTEAAPAPLRATGIQRQSPPTKTPADQQALQKQAAQPNTAVPTAAASATATPDANPVPRADPLRANLNAAFFVDGQRGWAVGEGGAILATRDGGSSWAAQTSGSRAALWSVQFATDGLRGWAVGEGGTILATRDGGSSWAAQTSGSRAALRSMQFATDGLRGWTGGDGGTILATRDGGGSWAAQTIGSRAALRSMQFSADGLRGWTVGDDGTILATRDGGGSWAAQTSGSRALLRSVEFAADGQRGWAVGDTGTILATRDGGGSWAAQTSGSRASLRSVQFAADGLRGWAVGEGGTILATRDGGGSWAAQTSGSRAWLSNVQFAADHLRGWAVGRDGTILATRDGGSSWAAQTNGSRSWLRSVQLAADGLRGWAVGDAGTILATRDGGSSWAAQTSGTGASLWSVQFTADGQRGWAVGGGGAILATRDGGSSWAAQTSGARTWLMSVQFAADGQRGWAVGEGGTILATRDGGSSWATQTNGSRAWLRGMQFAADGLRGWAVGDGGTILATRDGGGSWAAQASGTGAWLRSMQFAADGLRGWAVGDGGTILATRDGGGSWAAQASGTHASLRSVQFAADGLRGWAAGEGGTILATRDGGQQWSAIAPYQRFWAPWYFAGLTLLALAVFALLGFVESTRTAGVSDDDAAATGGAATFLRSDQPVANKNEDRLGVRPVVEALSSFIRNRDTEPRVTIAVTGEWGNGKSSVMRMLQTELQRAGFRTAWFNAWHHQQEGKQMSALFNVVRSQAVPQWWRQPLAALRVRSRLIWGRGWFYKTVAVLTALVLVLLAGNLLADGWRSALERTQANFRHHVLQQKQTAITGVSLTKLDPFAKAAAEKTPSTADPCDTKPWPPGQKADPIRPAVYCYLKRSLLSEEGGDTRHCGVQDGRNCVFERAEDLLATIEARDVTGERKLWPSERKAIRAAAETIPPPPMFPWLDSAVFGALAASLALLFTKGIAVYGLQLTAPLRTLIAAAQDKAADGGKEASGSVERYRTEFRLLCEALDGRLVIFIDDLDRCTPETVNGMLELTNYLADVGRCFIVIGAAMDRVLKCVKSPVGDDPDYPTAYLRKLVHIELPVPQNRELLNQLAAAPPAAPPQRLGLQRRAWLATGAAAMLGALVLTFLGGGVLREGSKGKALEVNEAPVIVAPLPPGLGPGLGQNGVQPSPPSVVPETPEVGLVPVRAAEVPYAWLGGALLLLLAALGVRWLRRNREQIVVALGGALRSEDSDRFMQALEIWNPVVVSYDPTPRHVKRFYNRARLFAAYEQQQGGENAASDESLVALAAMHHLDPALLAGLADAWAKAGPGARAQDVVNKWLDERAFKETPDPTQESSQEPPKHGLQSKALFDAWARHLKTFNAVPGLDQIRRFARRVEGILVR